MRSASRRLLAEGRLTLSRRQRGTGRVAAAPRHWSCGAAQRSRTSATRSSRARRPSGWRALRDPRADRPLRRRAPARTPSRRSCGELRGLLAADPTDEALAALAMLAAYRVDWARPMRCRCYETVRLALERRAGRDARSGAHRPARADRAPGSDAHSRSRRQSRGGGSLPQPPNPLIGRERELSGAPRPPRSAERPSRVAHGRRRQRQEPARAGARPGTSRAVRERRRARRARVARRPRSSSCRRSRERSSSIPAADALAALPTPSARASSCWCSTTSSTCGRRRPDLVRLLAAAPRVVDRRDDQGRPPRVGRARVSRRTAARGRCRRAVRGASHGRRPGVHARCHVDVRSSRRSVAASTGCPLAIELAAARVRALGLPRARRAARLPTGGAAPAARATCPRASRRSARRSHGASNLLEPREAEALGRDGGVPPGLPARRGAGRGRRARRGDDVSSSTTISCRRSMSGASAGSGCSRPCASTPTSSSAHAASGPSRRWSTGSSRSSPAPISIGVHATQVEMLGHVLDVALDSLRDTLRHARARSGSRRGSSPSRVAVALLADPRSPHRGPLRSSRGSSSVAGSVRPRRLASGRHVEPRRSRSASATSSVRQPSRGKC